MHRIRLLAALVLALALLLLRRACARPRRPASSSARSSPAAATAGASFANDFVELFNAGSGAVDLTGWTVQYASASSTSLAGDPAVGLDPAGRLLPRPARVGRRGRRVAAGARRDRHDQPRRLRRQGRPRARRDRCSTCGATAGSCSAVAAGRGPRRLRLGDRLRGLRRRSRARAARPPPTRGGAGCTDTGDSASDFAGADADPRNSSAATASCCGAPPRGRRRLAGRGGRHRRPAGALDRARAADAQLRRCRSGRHAGADLRAGDGRAATTQTGYALTDAPVGVRPGRPAARRRRLGTGGRAARHVARPAARSRRSRSRRRPTSSSARSSARERRRRGTSGRRASGSPSPLPVVAAGPVHGDGHLHGDRPVTARVASAGAGGSRPPCGRQAAAAARPPCRWWPRRPTCRWSARRTADGPGHELRERRWSSTSHGPASPSTCAAARRWRGRPRAG